MKVGVVIPFYQRQAGILPRALNSIRNQVLPTGVELEVIVVDDESPVPAASEMSGFTDTETIRWISMVQKNGGPGAARNTGIDRLAQAGDVGFVAFLDSDDEWRPDHIHNALVAMENGCDFYFSDHSREGEYNSYFKSHEHIRATYDRMMAAGTVLAGTSTSFSDTSKLTGLMLENYLAQTSTVVVTLDGLGQTRFDPELRYAGEDYMLWLKLSVKGLRFAISSESEVVCGKGVNLYYASYDWNSSGILIRLTSEIIFYKKLLALPLDAPSERLHRKLTGLQRLYAYLFARRLVTGRLPAKTGVLKLLRHDPSLSIKAPLLIFQFLLNDRRQIARG